VKTSSRRNFLGLGAGLAMPAMASVPTEPGPAQQAAPRPAAPASPRLVYGTIGKTGMRVTRVSFGCMTTSDQSVIERAVDLGINYFDTARVYQNGNNERMVGAALKKSRSRIYLASKTKGATAREVNADLETSLRELGTDHLDVWHLHARGTPAEVSEDVVEAQRAAKKAGKIRFAGVSFHSGHDAMIPAMLKLNHFDVFLLSYNFAMDPSIEPLIESARKAGVGVIAMKALAGGVRPTVSIYEVPAEKLNRLRREGAPVAALKWALKNPNVDCVIPSIVDQDQLDQNLAAMASPYSANDEKLLSARLEEIRPYYCRMCGKCEGTCSQGLPVPDMLRFLMYAESYGQFALGRENFRTLPEEVTSVRCGACESCSVHCSNGVQVASRLRRAQEIFA
jgi:predicted aldo/keto reductase-like oxidoreductase